MVYKAAQNFMNRLYAMTGKVFSVEFISLVIKLHFSILCHAYTVPRQYTGLPQENGIHSFVMFIITASNIFLNYITYL